MENISMMRLPATTLFGEGNPKKLDNEQHNQTIRSSKQCTKMRFENQMEIEPHPSESLHRECELYQQCEFTKSALQNFASSLGHYYAASERIENTKNHNKALPNPKRRVELRIEDGGCGGILHPEMYASSAHHTSILRSSRPAATTGEVAFISRTRESPRPNPKTPNPRSPNPETPNPKTGSGLPIEKRQKI